MRKGLLLATVAGFAALVGTGSVNAADKVKIGVTATLEGTYTVLGEDGMRGYDLAVVADSRFSLDAAERLYVGDGEVAVYNVESVRNVFVGGLQAEVRAGVRQHLLGPGEDFIGGTRQPFLTGVVEFERSRAQVGGVDY